MGVLAVRNTRSDRVLFFGTTNLPGKINSVGFQLQMGSFVDKGFQKDYDAGQASDICFTVVQVLKPDKSPGYDYRDDLKRVAKSFAEQEKAASEAGGDIIG